MPARTRDDGPRPPHRYRPAPGRQRRVEYYCRSTRGFSLHNRVKSLRSRPPPQCSANGRLTNRRENSRECAPVGRSPTTLPITSAGTNGRPFLWVIRCHVMTGPRGGSAPTTNSLNRARLGETVYDATLSFTSPTLTRKPPPPRPLPRPP